MISTDGYRSRNASEYPTIEPHSPAFIQHSAAQPDCRRGIRAAPPFCANSTNSHNLEDRRTTDRIYNWLPFADMGLIARSCCPRCHVPLVMQSPAGLGDEAGIDAASRERAPMHPGVDANLRSVRATAHAKARWTRDLSSLRLLINCPSPCGRAACWSFKRHSE